MAKTPTAKAAVTYTETFDTTTLKDGSTTADWDTTNSVLELPNIGADFYRIDDTRTTGYAPVIDGAAGNQFTRSLAVDSNGYPHVVWTADNGGDDATFYARWNGSVWVDAAGNDPETANCTPACVYSTDVVVSQNVPNGDSDEPSLILDSNDLPHIIWDEFDPLAQGGENDYDIKYATWSGTQWVKADGTAGVDDISNNAGDSWAPSIALVNGEPAAAWRDDTGGDVDIYYSQWNGSAWAKADNTAGFDDVSNDATTSEEASLAVTSDNRPVLAWRNTDGDTDVFLKQWNGSAWVGADGGATYDVSANATASSAPSLALLSNDRPAVAWTDDNQITYAQWSGTTWVGPDGTTAYPAAQTSLTGGAGVSAGRPSLRIRSDDRPAVALNYSLSGAASSRYTEWNGSTWTGATGLDADSNPATFEQSIAHYRSTPSVADVGFDLSSSDNPVISIGLTPLQVTRWIEPYRFPAGDFYKADLSSVGFDTFTENSVGGQGTSMASDSQGRTHVVWSEVRPAEAIYTVMYAYWNGTDWVSAKGTTVADDYEVSANPNTANTTAIPADLALDANDIPHITWQQGVGASQTDIYYTRWDPTENAGAGGWVSAADILYTDSTTPPAGTVVTSVAGHDDDPSIALTSSGTPYIAWYATGSDTRPNVFASTWNGSDWVSPTTGLAGRDEVSKDISTNQATPFPDIMVAPNNTVGIAWQLDTPQGGPSYIWYSQLKTGSPGTWTGADGNDDDSNAATYDYDQFGNGTALNQDLAFNSLSRPAVVWQETPVGASATDIMYSEWNGSAWVESDGTTAGDENISNDPDSSTFAKVQIDSSDEPYIYWNVGTAAWLTRHVGSTWTAAHGIDMDNNPATHEKTDVLVRSTSNATQSEAQFVLHNGDTPAVLISATKHAVWYEPYTPEVTGTSLTMDSLSSNITKATLTKTDTLNGGTITYQMSNDGGTTWSTVTPGSEFTFPTTGSDLRWRASALVGNPTDTTVTPQVDTLSIFVPDATEPEPEPGDAGIVVTESGGSTDISEVGPTSDDYTVVLTTQPSANVTVFISPNAQQTTDLATLTFTPSNWDEPQPVVTTAVVDEPVECNHTGLITHSASSSDTNYHGIAVASVVPNITDRCVRIEGDDPGTQSVSVSRERFPTPNSAPAAIIARNDVMADAFTGIPFASVRPAPLLLTTRDNLDTIIKDELTRVLSAKDDPIYILGREEAVTPHVYDQLRAAGFTQLIQVGGEHRRETAAKIALQIIAKQGTVKRAFVTEDTRLVDALGSGSAAGLLKDDNIVDPILLNVRGSTQIDPNTDAILSAHPSITSLELIGGDAALPLELNQTFTERYPHFESVYRSGGDDRYDTNALLAERFFPAPEGIVVANGEREHIPGALSAAANFVEAHFAALLGGTLAADKGFPLLVVRQNSVPAPIITYLIAHEPTIDTLYIIGSLSQVSQAVEDLIKSFI